MGVKKMLTFLLCLELIMTNGGNQLTIPVRGLLPGNYFLQISDGSSKCSYSCIVGQ